ncbi:MAG: 30S ribosomal protein S2 [uncultured bacterium (gcode 4)]|uniref:Small ribosomal subunit protein uS2 n=1 Tax=uncultured bacterium (gcode 4) TaxID=1234023 RepID=K2ADG6_9BACT|nr:MAG: 30S ribosomal protein S2 [uncultured bacterium (gcode 4)]
MVNKEVMKDMFDNAVHIWYKKQFWSPKMKWYIFGIQNWIHVFDLYKTIEKLEEVKTALKDYSEKGKDILFVGTKIQARNLVKELAWETGHFFVIDKWVPGLLTNFTTLKKRIATYNKIEKDLENWTLDMLSKKEKSEKMKELEKLKKAYEWLKELKKSPDVIFAVDGHYEWLSLTEARKMKIPSYALLGSTGDIDSCTNFIPCNVNSIKSIKFILDYLKPVLTKKKIISSFNKEQTNTRPFNKDFKKPFVKTETKPETTEITK